MKEKPNRPSMSKARRARIFEKEQGVCYLCNLKVQADEPWDAEHVKCWELYRDDSDKNLRVAHRDGCHKEKTNADNKIIRKAARQGNEKGQYARRMKRGYGLIKSKGFSTDGPKQKIPARPWPRKGD